MSLFHKKDKIPEIPLVPELPTLKTEQDNKVIGIPSLPTSQGDGRDQPNREAIKSAIEDSSEKNKGETSGAQLGSMKGFQESISSGLIPTLTKEEIGSSTQNPLILSIENIPMPPKVYEEKQILEEENKTSENIVKKDAESSIFVRIDKFNSAKRDIQEISKNLKNIGNVLTKLEEVKMQEDEEVAEISKIMEEIKLKMNRIDSDIFNRI